jgi:hypothetical protein
MVWSLVHRMASLTSSSGLPSFHPSKWQDSIVPQLRSLQFLCQPSYVIIYNLAVIWHYATYVAEKKPLNKLWCCGYDNIQSCMWLSMFWINMLLPSSGMTLIMQATALEGHYPPTKLQGVTAHKFTKWTLTTVKTSNFIQ